MTERTPGLDRNASISTRTKRARKNPDLYRAARASSLQMSSRTRLANVRDGSDVVRESASAAAAADCSAKKIPSRVIGSTRPAASPTVSQPGPESVTDAKSSADNEGIGHE